MRFHVPCAALGLALVALAPRAHAQAVIAPAPVVVPPAAAVVSQPVQITRTVTTRTVRPLVRRRVAVTRRTYVRERALPSTTTTTTTTIAAASAPAVAAAYPAPVYDYAAPTARRPYYGEPLYDTVVQTPAPVAPAPAVVPAAAAVPAAPAAVPIGAAVPFYRYVYEPDRILVIDPNSGIAVQALPR